MSDEDFDVLGGAATSDGKPRPNRKPEPVDVGTSEAADELRSFVERIERLEEEKKTVTDDIKDVYGEAKGRGYDTKVIRKVISLRKQDRDERAEQEAVLDLYLTALGMN